VLARALGIAVGDVLDLSASLSPCAPDVGQVVTRHLGGLRRYPNPDDATKALAEAIGIDRSRVLLCNGGAEAIALVASVMPVGSIADPDFSLYRRHLVEVRDRAPSWRSDPHNPTGVLAPADRLDAVRDEAFYPLTTGRWTRGDAGAVVVGSLTKLWACPGLRLGYVIAPEDDESLIDELTRRQPAWSVGGLAAAVIPDLLELTDLVAWSTRLAGLRRDLVELLNGFGYPSVDGAAPYVWVPSAPGLRDRLARSAVLVRSGASFGSPDAIRVAVTDEQGLARLDHALRASDGPV